jgi:hypothetical protein
MRTSRQAARIWTLVAIVALIFFVGSFIAVKFVIGRAEPILESRVMQTLSARFRGKVVLQGFGVAIGNGLQVTGQGLKILRTADPNLEAGVQPLLTVRVFRFQTSLRSLFRWPMHVDTVYVDGLDLNIPPKGDRQQISGLSSGGARPSIFYDKVVCQDARLTINGSNPSKPPIEFDISNLTLKDVGPGQPFQFDATLVNPKPVGDIHSTGLFGPWDNDSPRDSAVQGEYSFSHADLGTIKGLGGILSSTGKYEGTLGNIVINGSTDTPDFRVAISGHPVPLHTEFHAIVDGTNGDTYLRPVNATFLRSALTAQGSVIREKNPHGHDIELDVKLEHARIEDLLQLGVHTEPPIMTGPVEMSTRLSLPPGKENVSDRLGLEGTFHVPSTHFTNEKIQGKLDTLSLLSQGKPKEAHEHLGENIPSDLRGKFTLKDGLLSFSALHFLIPGTNVDMTGVYSLDGKTFDFRGDAKLQAKLSQMTTGWKSILLKPIDPFFRKNGAGTEIPIEVSGTESAPHFGLDFGHKNESGGSSGKPATVSQAR